MENSMEVPQKTKIELLYDSAIPLLGIYSDKTIIQKDTWTPMFTAALFTIAQTWKQPKCPLTDEWIKKMWYTYTMEYYSTIKKEWNNAICSNMDGTTDYHTKWSKSERERQIPYDITYVESKIWHKWTYLWNRNRLTDIENRLVVAKGEGVGRGMEWEFGISRCKLLYIGWINNKVLLYNTENYFQYPMINHNEKEY